MSQILEAKSPSRIYQDMILENRKNSLQSLAKEAKCYVCSKEMGDGYSLTAKNTSFGTLLFCDKHYSTNQIIGVVTAPCAAEPTRDANFASAPSVQFGFGLTHWAFRFSSSSAET